MPRAPLDDRNPHGSVDAEFPASDGVRFSRRARRAPTFMSSRGDHSLLGVTLLQGAPVGPPPLRQHRHAVLTVAAASPGVSLPSAVTSAKGPVLPGLPTPGTLRPRSSNLPRRLAPLHTSRAFLPRPLLGLRPSGPCLLPRIPAALSSRGCPLGIARPDARTLAMSCAGPDHREVHEASPVDRVSCLQGFIAPREAVPVDTG